MLSLVGRFHDKLLPIKLAAVLRLIGVTTVAVTALTVSAHACSIIATDVPNGVIDAWRQQNLPLVPRNAAFVWSSSDGNKAMPKEPVMVAFDSTYLDPVKGRVFMAIANRPGVFIAKLDEPMAPHLTIRSAGTDLTTDDYLDEAPPSTPQIVAGSVNHVESDEGCSGTTDSAACEGLTGLGVTLGAHATDDHMPPRRVAYLVYLERSAEAARTTRTPFALASLLETTNGPTLALPVGSSWVDSDAFVSVSAIDWAGNESPRSEPYQVNANGSGCAVRGSRRHRPTIAFTFAILTGLACVRRWKRRRS